MNESVELIHTGYANDYVGKGLSGGHITVKADDKIRIYKDSFEAWYKSQNRHTIVAS